MEPELLCGADVVQARRRLAAGTEAQRRKSDNEARVGGVDQAFTADTTKSHSSGHSN